MPEIRGTDDVIMIPDDTDDPMEPRHRYVCSCDPGFRPISFTFSHGRTVAAVISFDVCSETGGFKSFRDLYKNCLWDRVYTLTSQFITDHWAYFSRTDILLMETQCDDGFAEYAGMIQAMIKERTSCSIIGIRPWSVKTRFKISMKKHGLNKTQVKLFIAHNIGLLSFEDDEVMRGLIRSSHYCDAIANLLFYLITVAGLLHLDDLTLGPFDWKLSRGLVRSIGTRHAPSSAPAKTPAGRVPRRPPRSKSCGIAKPSAGRRRPPSRIVWVPGVP